MFLVREAYTSKEQLLNELEDELRNRLTKGSVVKVQIVEDEKAEPKIMKLLKTPPNPYVVATRYLKNLENSKNPLFVILDDREKYFFNISNTELILYREDIETGQVEKQKPIALNEIKSIRFRKMKKSKHLVIYNIYDVILIITT
jgi:hypothetical protein